VIVRCPSCGTQYEHQTEQIGVMARCSRCEDCVPIQSAKPNYVLRSVSPVAGPDAGGVPGAGIGMDDPLLADRLRRTGLDVSADSASDALTYRIAARGSIAADDDLAAAEEEFGEPETAPRPVDTLLEARRAEMAKPAQSNPLRELLLTALLTAAGAMGGYYLSLGPGLTLSLRMATGGTLGLLLSWLCIRWMRPER
jgi:predicted Zn finger-like uncharacterized protein